MTFSVVIANKVSQAILALFLGLSVSAWADGPASTAPAPSSPPATPPSDSSQSDIKNFNEVFRSAIGYLVLSHDKVIDYRKSHLYFDQALTHIDKNEVNLNGEISFKTSRWSEDKASTFKATIDVKASDKDKDSKVITFTAHLTAETDTVKAINYFSKDYIDNIAGPISVPAGHPSTPSDPPTEDDGNRAVLDLPSAPNLAAIYKDLKIIKSVIVSTDKAHTSPFQSITLDLSPDEKTLVVTATDAQKFFGAFVDPSLSATVTNTITDKQATLVITATQTVSNAEFKASKSGFIQELEALADTSNEATTSSWQSSSKKGDVAIDSVRWINNILKNIVAGTPVPDGKWSLPSPK